jgi:hypothetical protein
MICGRQSLSAFEPKEEERDGQGNQTAKGDDLQHGIIAADPFDRNGLQRTDQHCQ